MSRAIRKWEEASISPWEYEQFVEYNDGPDEEEYLEDSSRTSRIKRFIERAQPAWKGWATNLRQRLLDDTPAAERTWFELGECLDAGIRRPDVYLYMWQEGQPPILRPGEKLHHGHDGRMHVTITRPDKSGEGKEAIGDDWEFSAMRSANTFANCSREAGDVPPEAGWMFELTQRLRAAAFEIAAVVGEDDMSGVPMSKSALLQLAEKVDRNIRGLLAPTVPSWDGTILRLGERIVKDLRKQPNSNQGKLFAKFEQCGWQAEIPNPFKHSERGHAISGAFDVVLLEQTIKGCNDNQRTPLLKFTKAKEGRAVAWGLSNP